MVIQQRSNVHEIGSLDMELWRSIKYDAWQRQQLQNQGNSVPSTEERKYHESEEKAKLQPLME